YNVVKKLTEEQKRQGLSEIPTVAEAQAISAGEFTNYVRDFYLGNSSFVRIPPSQVTVTPIEPHLANPPINLQQNSPVVNPPLKNIGEHLPNKMDIQVPPNTIKKESLPTVTPSPSPSPTPSTAIQTQEKPMNVEAPAPKVESNTPKDKSLEITTESADIELIKPDAINLAGRNNKSLKNLTRH
ncbi:MAG: hypothetical protein WCJ33_05125, partial [Pseudomonadota bacterium]